jgi:hypothetical protein
MDIPDDDDDQIDTPDDVLIFERLASRFVDIKFQNIVYVW